MKTNLRKVTMAWPLVIFLMLPALTRAETAVQAWVQRYNGPGNLAGWAPVFTNTTPTNVLLYTDPNAGNCLRRF